MPVPSTPTDVYALPLGNGSVKLIWKAMDVADNINGYEIFYHPPVNRPWQPRSAPPVTSIKYIISTVNKDQYGFFSHTLINPVTGAVAKLTPGTTYVCGIRSLNYIGASNSNSALVIPYDIPKPVINLQGTLSIGSNASYTLSWNYDQSLIYGTLPGLNHLHYRIAESVNNRPWNVIINNNPGFNSQYNRYNSSVTLPIRTNSYYKARVRLLYRLTSLQYSEFLKLMNIYPAWSPLGLTADRLWISSNVVEMTNNISNNNSPGNPIGNYIRFGVNTTSSREIHFGWSPPIVAGNYPITGYQFILRNGNEPDIFISPKITPNGNNFDATYLIKGTRQKLISLTIIAINSMGYKSLLPARPLSLTDPQALGAATVQNINV